MLNPAYNRIFPRGLRLTALCLFLTLAGTGCNRGAGSSGAADGITLHIADWGGASSDPAMSRFERDVQAEWNRLHPDIHIASEHIPGSDEYVSKMLTAFVAGTEPDVMTLDASSAAAFIANNTLRNLTPFARAEHFDLDVYYPNVLDMARRHEHLYALPADFTPMMLYYNKRLFDRAGVPYPQEGWTWQEFRLSCQKLTTRPPGSLHPTQYGFLVENWMPGWIPWIWQNGGDVLSPDGSHAAGALDSPTTQEALGFFADLVRDGFAPSLSQSQAQGANPFQSGLVAMQISGHWNLVGLKASETLKLEDVGVVGLPQNRRRITVLYESGYAMTQHCKHPQAAWEYIKFWSGPFVQRKKAELGLGISANRQIAESRRSSSPLEPAFLDNVRYGIAPWGARVENYAQVEDIGKEMMEQILVGHVSVEKASREAAQRIDAELGTAE